MGGNVSRSRSTTRVPPEFKRLRGPVAFQLENLIAGGPQFEGPFTADIGTDEQAALENVQARTNTPFSALGRGALESTIRGDFLSPDSNPFLRDTIAAAQRSVLERFNENEILERSGFANAGQRLSESSPFARARAIATRGLGNSLSDIATNLAGGNFQAERNRQLAAVSQGEQVSQGEFDRAVENLRAQALPRLIEQLGIDRGLEEFRRRVDLMLNATLGAGQLSISGPQKSVSTSAGGKLNIALAGGGGG